MIRAIPYLAAALIGIVSAMMSGHPPAIAVLMFAVAAAVLYIGSMIAAFRRINRIDAEMRAHLSKHHPMGERSDA